MSGQMQSAISAVEPQPAVAAAKPVLAILGAAGLCHFLNDLMQSLLPAIYPVLKPKLGLDYGQLGLITLAFFLTASLLQPFVGLYTDRHPKPFSLPIAMLATLVGLVVLSVATGFYTLLVAASLIGLGSAVFHPEAARVARMASGGRFGMAQSVFQVGGNAGTAAGPLLAAFIVVPRGQHSVVWFSGVAVLAIVVLTLVSRWYRDHLAGRRRSTVSLKPTMGEALSSRRKAWTIAILIALIFSKYFYMASINTYLIFFMMQKFQISVQDAQFHLFLFLGAVAVGTLVGGPIGDRIGRKYVIWVSVLGVFPFTMALPYASLFWTGVLTVIIGMILASAFPAIIVYAQELMPGNVGAIAGLFFGFAFGMGGLGAAVLGELADRTSITFVYSVCAFLPAIGLLAVFLPNLGERARKLRPA